MRQSTVVPKNTYNEALKRVDESPAIPLTKFPPSELIKVRSSSSRYSGIVETKGPVLSEFLLNTER
jgi:hypothetical protein